LPFNPEIGVCAPFFLAELCAVQMQSGFDAGKRRIKYITEAGVITVLLGN
jgi:hypothetical protein